jgi:hypothetical protein
VTPRVTRLMRCSIWQASQSTTNCVATCTQPLPGAFRIPTGLRSPWNVDSGSASAPTVAEAGMADEPAVVAGAGITEECVDAVTQARAMLIRHEAAEIVEAAGMRETLTSRQGCHA